MAEGDSGAMERAASQIALSLQQLRDALYAFGLQLNVLIAEQREGNELVQTLGRMEAGRARAVLDHAREVHEAIGNMKNEAQGTLNRETQSLQDEYDVTYKDTIVDFVEMIKVNTDVVNKIKSEYGDLHDSESSFLRDIERFREVHPRHYDERRSALIRLRDEILRDLDDTMKERAKTAQYIEGLQASGISMPPALNLEQRREGIRFLVPFLVSGISIGGEEKIRISPVLRRTAPKFAPSRGNPYVDHLDPFALTLVKYLDAHRDLFELSAIVQRARRFSVLSRKKEIIARMSLLAQRHYIHSPTFLEAIDRFKDVAIGQEGGETE